MEAILSNRNDSMLPYTLFTPEDLSEFQNNSGKPIDRQLKISDRTHATILISKKLYNEVTQLRLQIEYTGTDTWVAFKFRCSDPEAQVWEVKNGYSILLRSSSVEL
ncbi:MAG: hypothetical protein K0S55_914, partial [Clostridia bacterium]|nr:hypothetical protein [Clostridia bacterium]